MKVVINECFGGFSVSDFVVEQLGLDSPRRVNRVDERLITLIEEYGSEKCSGRHACLSVVEMPDNTTDWEISEYDGSETLIYVVDGKLYHW
jgi:hypothetical protein